MRYVWRVPRSVSDLRDALTPQDINTPETSESGSLHGCPVAFLLGLPGCDLPEFAWVKPLLKANKVAYIGLRDVDAPEKRILKENGIAAFSMHHVDRCAVASKRD